MVQDSILPTVACIMGAAEAAYLAQSEVLYRAILGRMPVVTPRTGFTILDQHSEKLMTRYNLALPDFFSGEGMLANASPRAWCRPRFIPPWNDGQAVDHAIERLRGRSDGLDPTLAQALDPQPTQDRLPAFQDRGQSRPRGDAPQRPRHRRSVVSYGLIFPERHLQERLLLHPAFPGDTRLRPRRSDL